MLHLRYKYIYIIILFFSLLPLHGTGINTQKAEELYNKKNYPAALAAYTEIINDSLLITTQPTLAASIYYNIGNCYYRTKDYAKAVYSYQQSLRLYPSDKDAAYNLQLAQSKLTDHFDEPPVSIFSIAFRSIVLCQSATAWGIWAITFMIVLFISWYTFKSSFQLKRQKISFFVLIFSAICCLLSLAFAYIEHNHAYPKEQAVIMQSTQAFATPSITSKVIRELHEGVLINIKTKQADGWQQIEMPDGNEAWIKGENPLKLH